MSYRQSRKIPKNRIKNRTQHGLSEGYRSGLEKIVAKDIKEHGHKGEYEATKIPYTIPESIHTYTPDFTLDNGIIIETKGRFVVKDRMKHLLIKEQKPDLDIRFVFSNPNCKLSKQSKTTYATWCLKHGFKYSKKEIPDEWFLEGTV